MKILTFTLIVFCFSSFGQSSIQDLYLRVQNSESVNQAVTLLDKEFLENYVLLKKSSGFQVASQEYPRVLLYNSNASITLTLATDESHPTSKDIEVLSYNNEKQEYELHVIFFKNGKAHLSQKNPQACTNCHGLKVKPLWEKILPKDQEWKIEDSNQIAKILDLPIIKNLSSKKCEELCSNSDAYTFKINKHYKSHLFKILNQNLAFQKYPDLSAYLLQIKYLEFGSEEFHNLENVILKKIKLMYPDDYFHLMDDYQRVHSNYKFIFLKSMFFWGNDYRWDLFNLSFNNPFAPNM